MYERDESRFTNYNYGDAEYWEDERYMEDGTGSSFDWYQRYSALRPYLRKYIHTTSRVLMVGCGNAGTFDSLMCGIDARISVSSMLNEVSRLLRPGGLYILITYGDPTVRVSHFKSGRGWKILLYIIHIPQRDQSFKAIHHVVHV